MSKSLADVIKEEKKKYKTSKQTFGDFPVGTRVKVIVSCQDFTFFNNETGVVVRNSGGYMGIIVKFDKKFHRCDFNFEPDDLIKIGYEKETEEKIAKLLTQREKINEKLEKLGAI